MIDFRDVKPAVNLTEDYLLSKVSEEQIFFYYFGAFELGKAYPSKFRKDNKPSTGFYISHKSGKIIYNDLATGKKYNCISFVGELYSLRYWEAMKKIACDFGIISGECTPIAKEILNNSLIIDRDVKRKTKIQIIPSKWQQHHLSYWKDYYIGEEQLRREEVYPVQSLFINDAKWHSIDELCFAYRVLEKNGKQVNEYLKIYQPHSTYCKWISNVPLTVPFGMYNLKYGNEHIIITKAMKDMLVLRNLFGSVIGTQNESESALYQHIKHLTFNFERRTIIWDADSTGVENCKKFNDKGFGYFNTPNNLLPDIKDVSDYVKMYGPKALRKLLLTKNIL